MLRLNLGCGPLRIESELGVDKYPTSAADVLADINNLPFENNSCEFVRLDHVLEHIETRKVVRVLIEVYRVLCTGGIIRVGVPDFYATCEAYLEAENNGDRYLLIRNFYGSQAHDGEFHKSGWDKNTLYSLLNKIGFKEINIQPDVDRTEGICIFATGVK